MLLRGITSYLHLLQLPNCTLFSASMSRYFGRGSQYSVPASYASRAVEKRWRQRAWRSRTTAFVTTPALDSLFDRMEGFFSTRFIFLKTVAEIRFKFWPFLCNPNWLYLSSCRLNTPTLNALHWDQHQEYAAKVHILLVHNISNDLFFVWKLRFILLWTSSGRVLGLGRVPDMNCCCLKLSFVCNETFIFLLPLTWLHWYMLCTSLSYLKQFVNTVSFSHSC